MISEAKSGAVFCGCGEEIETDEFGLFTVEEEAGEFWDPIEKRSVLLHVQCGLDKGWDLA